MASSLPQPEDRPRRIRDPWFLLVPAAAILRLVNLGFLDLQAWDEALYAVRAQAIVKFGVWVDQTAYAIDGLYSSLHPPFHVWLTALSFLLFGVNEFSARLIAALAGAGTVFAVYALGCELHSRKLGIVAALFYGLNPSALFYSRQGQFDSALVLFLSLTVLALLKMERRRLHSDVAAAGLSLGAALLSKAYVALGIPFCFVLTWSLRGRDERAPLLPFFWSFLIGALVALPWYVFMQLQHGGGDALFFVRQSQLVERTIYGIEGNVKPLEFLYFVNQLLVQFSIGVPWLLYGCAVLIKKRDARWLLPGVWFLLFFAVFSIMRTKLAVYLLPMLVPASLFAAYGLLEYARESARPSKTFVLLGGTGLLFLWGASQTWRTMLKAALASVMGGTLPGSGVLYGLALFAGSGAVVLLLSWGVSRISVARPAVQRTMPVILMMWGITVLLDIFVNDRIQYRDGATELATLVEESGYVSLVVAGYERNPQLTYYLGGADIGWREDLRIRRIIPPKDTAEYRSWFEKEISGEGAGTLLIVEKDKLVRNHFVDPSPFVPADWKLLFRSRRYDVYRRLLRPDFAFGWNSPERSVD